MKRLLIAGFALVFLIFGLWFVAVPESLLSGVITGSFRGSPVGIQVVDLEKGLFYNVSIGQIVLTKSGETVLSVDNAAGRLSFSSLLRLKPAITFHGDIAGGTVKGTLSFSGKSRSFDVTIEDAHIEEIPFFARAGLGGKGLISGEYRALNNAGKLKFTVEDVDIGIVSFGGMPVPLNMIRTARGAMETNGRVLKITSFAMEGKGIYARVKGDVSADNMNLIVEVMPDATLQREDPMFSLIRKYEVSPGYYSIPIRNKVPY